MQFKCIYCGEDQGIMTCEEAADHDHVKACKMHPMRELERKIGDLDCQRMLSRQLIELLLAELEARECLDEEDLEAYLEANEGALEAHLEANEGTKKYLCHRLGINLR